MPQTAPGWRIDPPVSVPIASGVSNEATAAAEPPDEPPGTRLRSQGLRDGADAAPIGGTTVSSRNTLVTGTACVVGGIPSAATSWTLATAAMITSSWPANRSSSSSPSASLERRARWATSSRVIVRVSDMDAILGAGTARSRRHYQRHGGALGAAWPRDADRPPGGYRL